MHNIFLMRLNVFFSQNIWREERPTCPICLGDFCAARMTKCGHIYCWPCMLHYLALEEKTWRKCPICHDAVHKKDLKRFANKLGAFLVYF